MAKEDRGFASMSRTKQREIASKGGKAAHAKGTAHKWTSEEARQAGRKGGLARHRRMLAHRPMAIGSLVSDRLISPTGFAAQPAPGPDGMY